MKNSLLLCLLFLANMTFAQTDEYKAKNDGWLVKIDEAYKESKKTGKPILANFTGSDWCGWCKRFDRDVFHKKEFKDWAKKNVVLLELDFPKRFKIPAEIQQQNRSLQQFFGVRGYPTIWVFNMKEKKDAAGQFEIEPLGKTQYTKTPKKFISDVERMIKKGK